MKIWILNLQDPQDGCPAMLGIYSDLNVALKAFDAENENYPNSLELTEHNDVDGYFSPYEEKCVKSNIKF